MDKIIQFINDFKKSPALEALLTDNKTEPIMIWVAGSVWLGTADDQSDYDLCILVKELPKPAKKSPWQPYGRPGHYFLKYKPQNKKVDIIYTSVDEIFNMSESTPLANIGWAQIKYWPEESIIYKNPKYLNFINNLFAAKETIFKNSVYLFIKAALSMRTKNNDLSELIQLDIDIRPNKALAQICWISDLLQKKTLNVANIIAIKRNLYSALSQDIHNYIFESIKYLEQYFKNVNCDKLALNEINNAQAYFKKFI